MTNTELFLAVAVAAVLVALIFVLVQLSDLEKKYKYLHRCLDERVDKWRLECTDREAKEMRECINAIEKHLGIELVKQPARMAVKTGEIK
jgi:hypothetical protein